MGGYGSGRWRGHSKATRVEDCLALGLGELKRAGIFRSGCTGTYRWLSGERETAAIGIVVAQTRDGLVLILLYTRRADNGRSIAQVVPLEALPQYFGGVRWWGWCPCCRRRVGKLYLAPGHTRFGCRVCFHLTYESAQTHDKRVDELRSDPERLAALLSSTDKTLRNAANVPRGVWFRAFRDRMLAIRAMP